MIYWSWSCTKNMQQTVTVCYSNYLVPLKSDSFSLQIEMINLWGSGVTKSTRESELVVSVVVAPQRILWLPSKHPSVYMSPPPGPSGHSDLSISSAPSTCDVQPDGATRDFDVRPAESGLIRHHPECGERHLCESSRHGCLWEALVHAQLRAAEEQLGTQSRGAIESNRREPKRS